MMFDISSNSPETIRVVKWADTDNLVYINFHEITPETLRNFLSPRISPVSCHQMFVYGICIITWLNSKETKYAKRQHHVDITISNSSGDSGDITTAGYFLFKHPTYTHIDDTSSLHSVKISHPTRHTLILKSTIARQEPGLKLHI